MWTINERRSPHAPLCIGRAAFAVAVYAFSGPLTANPRAEVRPIQIDTSRVVSSSELRLSFTAMKPSTTTPANMDRTALDHWFATGGPQYSIVSNDTSVVMSITRALTQWHFRPSRHNPSELDLRYRLEITADGEKALLLYMSVRGDLLYEGNAYEAVEEERWLWKLWTKLLPPVYSPPR